MFLVLYINVIFFYVFSKTIYIFYNRNINKFIIIYLLTIFFYFMKQLKVNSYLKKKKKKKKKKFFFLLFLNIK